MAALPPRAPVVVVDVHGETGLCARRPAGCCALGVHPNAAGYDAMAAAWHRAVMDHAPAELLRAAGGAGRPSVEDGARDVASAPTHSPPIPRASPSTVSTPHADDDPELKDAEAADAAAERPFTAAVIPPRRRLWDAPPPQKPTPKAGGGAAPLKAAGKPAAKKPGAKRGARGNDNSSDDEPPAAAAQAGHGHRRRHGQPRGPGEPEDVPGLESSSGSSSHDDDD
eukprot:gene23401-16824_t